MRYMYDGMYEIEGRTITMPNIWRVVVADLADDDRDGYIQSDLK